MAKYKIVAEIYVEGTHIISPAGATEALCVMLGCYDDMDDTDTMITIAPLKTEKI